MIQLERYETNSSEYSTDLDHLQERLYILSKVAYERKKLIVIVLEGWSGTGKGDLLKTITHRLDPRKFSAYSHEVSSYSKKHHFLKKYWEKIPPNGHLFLVLDSWYEFVTKGFMEGEVSREEYQKGFYSISNFENTLISDDCVIYKFFLHSSKKLMKKRFKQAKKENRIWVLSKADKNQIKNYEEYYEIFEHSINQTNTIFAPWNIISAENKDRTKFLILSQLVSELEKVFEVDSAEILLKLDSLEDIVA